MKYQKKNENLEDLLHENEGNILTKQLIKEIMDLVGCGCIPEAKVWCEDHYMEMFTDMERQK